MSKKNSSSSDNDNNIIIVLILILVVFVVFNYLFTKENSVGNYQSPVSNEGFQPTPPGGSEPPNTASKPQDCDCGVVSPPENNINKKMISCRGTELEICHHSLENCNGIESGNADDQIYYILYPDIYGSGDPRRKNYVGVRRVGDDYKIHLSDQRLNSPSYKWEFKKQLDGESGNKFLARSMISDKKVGDEIILCDDGTFFSLMKYSSEQINASNCAWNISREPINHQYRYSNTPISHKFSGLTLESATRVQEDDVIQQQNKILDVLRASGINLATSGTSRDLEQAGPQVQNKNKPVDIYLNLPGSSADLFSNQNSDLLLGMGELQQSQGSQFRGDVFNSGLDGGLPGVNDFGASALDAAEATASIAAEEAAAAAIASVEAEPSAPSPAAPSPAAASPAAASPAAPSPAAPSPAAPSPAAPAAAAAPAAPAVSGFRNIISEPFQNQELTDQFIENTSHQINVKKPENVLLKLAQKLKQCSNNKLISMDDVSCEACDTSKF
jgi:hypothetical protein